VAWSFRMVVFLIVVLRLIAAYRFRSEGHGVAHQWRFPSFEFSVEFAIKFKRDDHGNLSGQLRVNRDGDNSLQDEAPAAADARV
jgi:hypothetical protein